MANNIQILYLENYSDNEAEPNPELELLELDGFLTCTVTDISLAKQILKGKTIAIMLIDVSLTNDLPWANCCLALIQNPNYAHVLKIVIDIDQDALYPHLALLNDVPSVVHFHYKADPDRYDKLLKVLKKYVG